MSRIYIPLLVGLILASGAVNWAEAQGYPSQKSNIPYLLTFGNRAEKKWGDDDYSMTFFFMIPDDYLGPVYIRVFDPDVGGEIDEMQGTFDTRTKFSVFGGKGAFSDPDSRGWDPKGNYRAGNLLDEKNFGNETWFDEKWYSFGPYKREEGEYMPMLKGFVYKLISEGVAGDDGNLFKYFLSSNPDQNIPIPEAKGFTFEYTFRMPDDNNVVCHLYPFIDENVASVTLFNFDWDNAGAITFKSAAKPSVILKKSGDGDWASDNITIVTKEHGKSLDLQFHTQINISNNNVVVRVTNQYDKSLPFYSTPIGEVGPPETKPTITQED